MRILLITDNHQPSGGAERYFFDLKARLQSSGMTVYSLGFAEEAYATDDCHVMKKPSSKRGQFLSRFLFNPLLYRRLRKQIAQFQPDIIHLHNVKIHTCTLLSAIRGYKVVQTIHDYSVICPTGWNVHRNLSPCATGMRVDCFWQHQTKFSKLVYLAAAFAQRQLKRQLQKTVQTFISPSPLLASYLQINKFKSVVTISPFIESSNPLPENLIKPFHFLYVGQLNGHKGVDRLLKEFARARLQEPRLHLTLVGEGSERLRLENDAGLSEHVKFVGWQQDLSNYYAQSVAVIFPSIGLESFGLVMTESMSRGRPVIASNRGHAPWLIQHQKSGLLYDPLREGELADCLLHLASQPESASNLGREAHNQINQLISNDKLLQQLLDCYQL